MDWRIFRGENARANAEKFARRVKRWKYYYLDIENTGTIVDGIIQPEVTVYLYPPGSYPDGASLED